MLSTVPLAYHTGGKKTTVKRDFPEDLRFVQLPSAMGEQALIQCPLYVNGTEDRGSCQGHSDQGNYCTIKV